MEVTRRVMQNLNIEIGRFHSTGTRGAPLVSSHTTTEVFLVRKKVSQIYPRLNLSKNSRLDLCPPPLHFLTKMKTLVYEVR